MKENWDLRQVQSYIDNKVKENINLDYKAIGSLQKTDKKKDEIAKDVSAFANSSGGTIIYGVPEVNNEPGEITEGLEPKEISKEWIEQIINSRIQPRIDGVRIYEIDLEGSLAGKVIFVVEIPKSNSGHMANDNKYYKRFNFLSIAMEDFEVKDLFNRSFSPILDLDYILESSGPHSPSGEVRLCLEIIFSIKNTGNRIAKFPSLNVKIDNNALKFGEVKALKEIKKTRNDKERYYAGSHDDVIHPETELEVSSVYADTNKNTNSYPRDGIPISTVLSFSKEPEKVVYEIETKIYSEDMKPITKVFKIKAGEIFNCLKPYLLMIKNQEPKSSIWKNYEDFLKN